MDAKQVGIEGLSRYGKAAHRGDGLRPALRHRLHRLVRRGRGEAAPPQLRRAGRERRRLRRVPLDGRQLPQVRRPADGRNDLPVDAHELVALCAPRPVFISVGSRHRSRAGGSTRGACSWPASRAGPVYELLGKKDLGTTEFPPQETALIDGEVAFRQHAGGHTTGPNWPTFLQLADRYLNP